MLVKSKTSQSIFDERMSVLTRLKSQIVEIIGGNWGKRCHYYDALDAHSHRAMAFQAEFLRRYMLYLGGSPSDYENFVFPDGRIVTKGVLDMTNEELQALADEGSNQLDQMAVVLTANDYLVFREHLRNHAERYFRERLESIKQAERTAALTKQFELMVQAYEEARARPRCTGKMSGRHCIHPTGQGCSLHGTAEDGQRLRVSVATGNVEMVEQAIQQQADLAEQWRLLRRALDTLNYQRQQVGMNRVVLASRPPEEVR